jgi:DNA invertase Pin-like site-specific DNA recombinase
VSQLLILAAEYVRMSTENQKYSIPNQQAAIREYAAGKGFQVCRTYADAGRSGLFIKQRDGLKELLHDVVSGSVDYKAVLVYDVTRWGRFLDADESAHYEFLCKSAGIAVHYCAESFQNDGSLPSTILKTLKRMMAAEYVRELSTKVYEGSKNISQRGFCTGGSSGYGFRRMLVSPTRELKQELQFGERKNIQQDRVILVPGSEQEVECVKQIFRMFTVERYRPGQIARELNRTGIPFTGKKHHRWNFNGVDRILRNPKYAGYGVYGRTTQRLGIPRTRIPECYWVKTPGVCPPIVSEEIFAAAEHIYANRAHNKTDEQLLAELRLLMQEKGLALTRAMLMKSQGIASYQSYGHRFGSLSEAFALVGYEGPRLAATKTSRRLRSIRHALIQEIVTVSGGGVAHIRDGSATVPKLQVRNAEIVGVRLCLSYPIKNGELRWTIRRCLHGRSNCAWLIVRLDANNEKIHDLHIVPRMPKQSNLTILPIDPWLSTGEKLACTAEFADIAQRVASPKSGFLFETE